MTEGKNELQQVPDQGGVDTTLEKIRPLIWKTYPFLEKPQQGISVIIFIAVVLVGVWFWTYMWYMVVFGALILFGSLLSYFLPTRFQLDNDGASIRRLGYKQQRPWKEFRCFYADARGLMLSTFDRPRRLDSFRGFNIRFSGNRDEVIEYVEQFLPKL